MFAAEFIFKFVEYITKGKYRWVGWFALRRRMKMDIENPWHFSTFSDRSLWGLSIHGFGLVFEVIGPFGVKKNVC
jgi:hypothetical protein